VTSGHPRAIVRSPIAPLFAEPRVSSVQISQLLAGHTVEVLEERDAWASVRGVDMYEGWMHRGYLHDGDGWRTRETDGGRRLSLGCTVMRHGARRALPLGAYLDESDRLASGDAIAAERQPEHFPREAGAITRTARAHFEGTSYQWGGVTPWGADCSGLVQSVYALHGRPMPRDAWQQAREGEQGEPNPLEAREGDLLFFSDRDDRHVTHVAIALGGAAIVHLALGRGGFGIEQLDRGDDPYVVGLVERFVGARRVL
jgi:cell wall-associated NlpC family hydrolase